MLKLYDVHSEINLTLSYSKVSENQKKALVYALYEMGGISSINFTITFDDGTEITPEIVDMEIGDIIVEDMQGYIVRVNDLSKNESEKYDKLHEIDRRYFRYDNGK